jgi:CRP-like cAMP-binding protein
MERSRGPLSGNLVEKLSGDDRARLFALGRSRVFEAGSTLVRQGSPGDCLFIVEEGTLAVMRSLPGGEEERLITAHPGMILGEMAVLDGGVRAASLRALERCVVRAISVGAFQALALHGGDPGLRVLRAVASMMHERLDATCSAADSGCDGQGAPVARLAWEDADPDVAPWLGILPSLAALDEADRASLAAHLATARLNRGDELALPHEVSPGVTLVLRGALSPWLPAEGRPHELRPPVGPGGFVEYWAALGFAGGARCWRACSPTRLLRLDAMLFDAASPCAARLLYALARDLASTLRRATGRRMHFDTAWAQAMRRASPASVAAPVPQEV